MESKTKSKTQVVASVIMKIKVNSDDDSPLNKPFKFHLMTITVRFVFEENGKLCSHVFLDGILYELNV